MQFQVQNGIKEATVILEGETEKFSINYQEAVQNILNKIKKTYGAFPGLETPAGILKINVNEGKKEEILLRDTEEVKIAIDLAPLKDIKTEKIQDYFEYLLSYELYRGLAQFNHQEQEIRQEIKNVMQSHENELREAQKILLKALENIAQHPEIKTEDKEGFEKRINTFNEIFFEKFYQVLEDMGLSVIAAEINDPDYFENTVQEEQEGINEMKEVLRKIKELRQKGARFMDIFEFTAFYEFLPFKTLPYYIFFGKSVNKYRSRSKSIIRQYRNILEKADPKVKFAFKNFWEKFSLVFDQSQVHHSLFKMEIQHHLYDAFYLDRAHEAYKSLKEQALFLTRIYKKQLFESISDI